MVHERIDVDDATLVLDVGDPSAPRVAYLGPRLSTNADLTVARAATSEGPRPSSADILPLVSVFPVAGAGFMGAPALVLGGGRLCTLTLEAIERVAHGVVLTLADRQDLIRVRQSWRPGSGCFRVGSEISNRGAEPLEVLWFAAATLPLPDWARTHWTFAGRWAGEFRATPQAIADGVHERVSRGGRPGFENAGFALLGDGRESDFHGQMLGLHLAWSGNARLIVEQTGFGLRQIQIGEALDPGAMVLGAGESYQSPEALVCLSSQGHHGVRRSFHREAARIRPLEPAPRRVHFNTWEAAYFTFDHRRLEALADAASALGAERFVLDDGWFRGRRNDGAGLGDWAPDPERFPQGLAPLIAHVEARGMDFGLWVEPEMVNPDSALFHAHPDWVLHHPALGQPLQRRQLVLDFTREDVRGHVLEQLDTLLSANRIAYLKWDHNRDLFPALGAEGPAAHRQTQGFLDVLDRLRAAHPHIEIESCASGGGRIDFAVLSRASRFWASDNTDAIERLRIQSDLSLILPLCRMGSHVGASPNPSTGRRLSMLFRARIAMFAHMGVEADPTAMDADDTALLAQHIALYKAHRALIHGGEFHSYAGDDPDVRIWVCVAPDRSEALGLAARVDQARGLVSPPVRLMGLDHGAHYAVELIRPWPEPARFALADAGFWRATPVLSGEVLERIGIRLPLIHPQTAWLWHLRRVEAQTQ